MNEKDRNRISKFLSLVLRHDPGSIGIELDENGWTTVEALVERSAGTGRVFSREDLEEIVVMNDKQRFSFNEDKTKIRANQGHSVEVELQLEEEIPPGTLYHGTVEKFLAPIRSKGLQKMSRHNVHLSRDKETAEKVGSRRGQATTVCARPSQTRQGERRYLFPTKSSESILVSHAVSP